MKAAVRSAANAFGRDETATEPWTPEGQILALKVGLSVPRTFLRNHSLGVPFRDHLWAIPLLPEDPLTLAHLLAVDLLRGTSSMLPLVGRYLAIFPTGVSRC